MYSHNPAFDIDGSYNWNSTNNRRGGRRVHEDYKVEEIDGGDSVAYQNYDPDENMGDQDPSSHANSSAPVNGDHKRSSHKYRSRDSHRSPASGGTTPRVIEPEYDYGRAGNYGSFMSSAIMSDPFGDDFDNGFDDDFGGGFFGGFGSMFGNIQRHMDNMRKTFSSAFNQIESMTVNGSDTLENTGGANGKTRMYCSSTHETILPNGVREVKHTSRDTATGKQTSYHSRQIGDRQIVEHSSRDMKTGVEERQRDLLNVNDQELDDFDRRWREFGLGSGPGLRSLR